MSKILPIHTLTSQWESIIIKQIQYVIIFGQSGISFAYYMKVCATDEET
jgi:hypothetical protein